MLAHQPTGEPLHLDQRVEGPRIVPTRELIHITVQVLDAHLVIRVYITTLEQRPEALNAIRVGLALHLLFHAMFDDFAI